MALNLDGQTRADKDIETDGGSFAGATLKRCRLIYRGGRLPSIGGLTVDDCSWDFRDAALNTMHMLAIIGMTDPETAQEIFERADAQIRAEIERPAH